MYRGRLFRSRLEARWSCLFDELTIPWAYEPIDLQGYIPDFIIHADLLLEVKPDVDADTLAAAQKKIDVSGWNQEAVIVSPFVESSAQFPVVGWFGERCTGPDGHQLVWDQCRIMRCLSCGLPSFFPDSGSWHCRRCSADGGNAHLGSIGAELETAWNEAGNRTQWRPE